MLQNETDNLVEPVDRDVGNVRVIGFVHLRGGVVFVELGDDAPNVEAHVFVDVECCVVKMLRDSDVFVEFGNDVVVEFLVVVNDGVVQLVDAGVVHLRHGRDGLVELGDDILVDLSNGVVVQLRHGLELGNDGVVEVLGVTLVVGELGNDRFMKLHHGRDNLVELGYDDVAVRLGRR